MVEAERGEPRRAARLRARCRRSAARPRNCSAPVVGRRGRARRRASTCCSATTRGCARGPRHVVDERPVGAARVAAGRLDHDHVGAEVGEQLARRTRRARSPARRRAGRRAGPAPRWRRSRHTPSFAQLRRSRRRRGRGLATARGRCARRGTGRRARSPSRSPTGAPAGRRRARRPSRGGARSATAPTRSVPGSWSMRPRAGDRRPRARRRRGAPRPSRTGRASRVHAAMRCVERVLRREALGQRVVARVGRPTARRSPRRGCAQSASSRHAIAIQSSSPAAG